MYRQHSLGRQRRRYRVHITMAGALIAPLLANVAAADALDRLTLDRLKAQQQAIELLKNDREPVALNSGLTDYRAVLHVHSHLSHDSNGSIAEIVKAAHKAGVRIVMFTEHPEESYDFFTDGHRGSSDGVLLIPGAEKHGLLSYPKSSVQDKLGAGSQEFSDAVRSTGGLTFLSHLEERMDWELNGLTGTEIYNTHADFKDETRLAKALFNPLTLMLQIAPAVKKYPQGVFAALHDYPAAYLKKWDALCAVSPHTGIAANDSHHNQGLRAKRLDDGKLQLTDGLGEVVTTLDPQKLPLLKPLLLGSKPGDTVFELDLDPYARSFRHVSTHLLMDELSEAAARDALQKGRAFVAFDWIADPSGFVFQAVSGDTIHAMGSEVPFSEGTKFESAAPLPGTFRLLRDGKEVTRHTGRSFEFKVTQAGIYRIEVWLNLAGEPKVWILSNPIYFRG